MTEEQLAVRFIGVIGEELVLRGYPGGDRAVILANIRALPHSDKAQRVGATLDVAMALVNEQALDEALWFKAKTAPEAYLQAALRKLHAAIEFPWPNPDEPV